MNTNFENVQVGEKLILRHSRNADKIVEVTRLTAKQFEAGGSKFWKKDGQGVGRSSWSSSWCVRGDNTEMNAVNVMQRKRNKANKVRNLISSANLMAMDEDSLDTIMKVLMEEKKRDEDR